MEEWIKMGKLPIEILEFLANSNCHLKNTNSGPWTIRVAETEEGVYVGPGEKDKGFIRVFIGSLREEEHNYFSSIERNITDIIELNPSKLENDRKFFIYLTNPMPVGLDYATMEFNALEKRYEEIMEERKAKCYFRLRPSEQ